MKPPAFQFYVDDYIGGTQHFSDAEKGLYVALLCEQWSNGSIPDDDDEIASFSRGGTAIHRVKRKFAKGVDGRLRNERMEIEREKQRIFRESRSANGQKGGRPKKASDNHLVHTPKANGEATESPPISDLRSPSPNAEREYVELPSLEEVRFHASTIGLGAWKAEDWFNEMEGCGWLDFNHRPVASWKAVIQRVKTKWDSDGRPKCPPISPQNGKDTGPKPPATTFRDGTPLPIINEIEFPKKSK